MFMKRPGHRMFDYTPRFYKPEKDELERRKRRLGFSRQRRLGKKKNSIVWIVFIILVIYIIMKLQGSV